jgi:hypothetical protein
MTIRIPTIGFLLPSVLLVAALGLSPVYMSQSGSAQLSDYIFIAYCASVPLFGYFSIRLNDSQLFQFVLLLYTFWISLVSFWWFLWTGSADFTRMALFSAYNFLVSIMLISFLVNTRQGMQVLRWGVTLALIISFIGIVVTYGESERPAGFFNNPNQLGYFSLCALGTLLVAHDFKLRWSVFNVLAVLSAVIGVSISASFASAVGFVCLIIAMLIANGSSVTALTRSITGLAALMGVLLVVELVVPIDIWGHLERRFAGSAEVKFQSMFEDRYYDRVLAFKAYWVFGAGDAHYERFYPYHGGEVHSSLGNLLLSFGLPGIGLFIGLLWVLLKRMPAPYWFVVAAPMIYSLTHMGLRFTMFWILLATVWAIKAGNREPGKGAALRL